MATLFRMFNWLLAIAFISIVVWTLDQFGLVRLDSIPVFRKTVEQTAKQQEERAKVVVGERERFCLTAGMWRDAYRESSHVQEAVGWTIKNRASTTGKNICDIFGFAETMVPVGYVRSKEYTATPEFVRAEAYGRSVLRPGYWTTYKLDEVLAVKIAKDDYQPSRPELSCAIAYIRRDRMTWKEEEKALQELRGPNYRRVLALEGVEFFCLAQ